MGSSINLLPFICNESNNSHTLTISELHLVSVVELFFKKIVPSFSDTPVYLAFLFHRLWEKKAQNFSEWFYWFFINLFILKILDGKNVNLNRITIQKFVHRQAFLQWHTLHAYMIHTAFPDITRVSIFQRKIEISTRIIQTTKYELSQKTVGWAKFRLSSYRVTPDKY